MDNYLLFSAIWDANKGVRIRKLSDHSGIVNSCSVARVRTFFVTLSFSRSLSFYLSPSIFSPFTFFSLLHQFFSESLSLHSIMFFYLSLTGKHLPSFYHSSHIFYFLSLFHPFLFLISLSLILWLCAC